MVAVLGGVKKQDKKTDPTFLRGKVKGGRRRGWGRKSKLQGISITRESANLSKDQRKTLRTRVHIKNKRRGRTPGLHRRMCVAPITRNSSGKSASSVDDILR